MHIVFSALGFSLNGTIEPDMCWKTEYSQHGPFSLESSELHIIETVTGKVILLN